MAATGYGAFAGQVGPAALANGATAPVRLTRTGGVGTADVHARFAEAVLAGNVYSAQTATTGVAHGTSLSTTAAFALHNPVTSSKKLVILEASMAYVSGTLGSGTVYFAVNTTAPTAGTAITPINRGSFTGSGSSALAYTTATVVAPTALKPFCTLTPILATSVTQPYTVVDYVDGAIVVPAGGTLILHSVAAAGTSPLVVFGMAWEEVAA